MNACVEILSNIRTCSNIVVFYIYIHTSLVAKIIVANCDLSPHSARNVNEKDCTKIGDTKPKQCRRRFITLIIPDSGSSITDVLDISCSYTATKPNKQNLNMYSQSLKILEQIQAHPATLAL